MDQIDMSVKSLRNINLNNNITTLNLVRPCDNISKAIHIQSLILNLMPSNKATLIMRNHSLTNNTKLISQNFGNKLKFEVNNDNGPEVLNN